jgi:glutamyl-tRNA reductase
MSYTLVNKLLHGPIQELKALAESGSPVGSVEVRRRLFTLEGLEVGLQSLEDRSSSL